MNNFDEVNMELYNLLKDRLKLKEYCSGFTLKVEFGEIPKVEECYYIYPVIAESKVEIRNVD